MSLERIAWNEMNNLYIHTQQCSIAKLWIKFSKMESIIMIANFLVQNESKKEKKNYQLNTLIWRKIKDLPPINLILAPNFWQATILNNTHSF